MPQRQKLAVPKSTLQSRKWMYGIRPKTFWALQSHWQDVLKIDAPGKLTSNLLISASIYVSLQRLGCSLISDINVSECDSQISIIAWYPRSENVLLFQCKNSCLNKPILGRMKLAPTVPSTHLIQVWDLLIPHLGKGSQWILLPPKTASEAVIRLEILNPRFFLTRASNYSQQRHPKFKQVCFSFG